jgi:hypothetical protein
MKTVLLGAAGTGTSFAIASRLRARWGSNLKLIVTDIFEQHLVATSLLADKCLKTPYATDSSFHDVICGILTEEKVDVYIPILNEEIILGAELQHDPRFKEVDIWSSALHAQCIDKVFADDWLTNAGVRTPRRYDPLQPITDDSSWICKPRSGFGSRGVRLLSPGQLQTLTPEEAAQSIIQEICAGPEITVDSFYDVVAGQGFSYCRERLEIKSGVCTKARLFFDQELDLFARKIGEALKQRGTLCFQVMQSQQGWAVTDLNLRSGAGTAMTCSAGFDVLAAGYACRIGESYAHLLGALQPQEEFYITRQYAEFVTRHTG